LQILENVRKVEIAHDGGNNSLDAQSLFHMDMIKIDIQYQIKMKLQQPIKNIM
jgi:hypothetical protein